MRHATAASLACCLLAAGCALATAPAATPPASLTARPTPAASPSASRPDGPTGIADLDGDGLVDLVTVDGGFARDDPEQPPAREGGVQAVLSGGTTHRLTMSQLGLTWSDSTDFGAGSLVADLDQDGYADVVVSDPTREPEGDSHGAIYVLWGGPDGLSATRFETLAVGAAGSFTGSALALVAEPRPVLAAGTGFGQDRGVALYPVGPDGSLGEPRLVDQTLPGIPGGPHRDSAFGSVLAADGDLLVVGDPGAVVASAARAGAVTLLHLAADDLAPVQLSQATAAVPGTAEAGDGFGSSLSIHDDLLAVGAPGEDVGSAADAGRVYLFSLGDAEPAVLASLMQGAGGVPGKPGQAYRFGEGLAVFRPCDAVAGILVSAPGEETDALGRQGAVHVVPVPGTGCAGASITGASVGVDPLGHPHPLTVLRGVDRDGAEAIAVVVADGVAVLEPPFTNVTVTHRLDGGLVAPAG